MNQPQRIYLWQAGRLVRVAGIATFERAAEPTILERAVWMAGRAKS